MAAGDHAKIAARYVADYKRLIESLISKYGSISNALSAIGISDHLYYRLIRDDEIVASTARKIVACYERTKAGAK